jgi:hypothetical protein
MSYNRLTRTPRSPFSVLRDCQLTGARAGLPVCPLAHPLSRRARRPAGPPAADRIIPGLGLGSGPGSLIAARPRAVTVTGTVPP